MPHDPVHHSGCLLGFCIKEVWRSWLKLLPAFRDLGSFWCLLCHPLKWLPELQPLQLQFRRENERVDGSCQLSAFLLRGFLDPTDTAYISLAKLCCMTLQQVSRTLGKAFFHVRSVSVPHCPGCHSNSLWLLSSALTHDGPDDHERWVVSLALRLLWGGAHSGHLPILLFMFVILIF